MKKKIVGIGLIIIGILNCAFVIISNNLNIQNILFLLLAIFFLPLGTKILVKHKLSSE